jgi:hypothetical protein
VRISPYPPAAATLIAVALLLASCGTPPGLAESPTAAVSGPASPTATEPSDFPSVFPTAGPLPNGAFPTDFAVSCAGDPESDDVLGVLRDREVVPAEADMTLVEGPLCAGDWQYTVVAMPDLDPLQVVTRRAGGGLELVTAGTDVCTVEVEVQAPPGILATAGCVG